MEKLQFIEQYFNVLSDFKIGKARCKTNKALMRNELASLIEAGKLYYEYIGNTLWFFSDEDYFYSAHFYSPTDTPVQMIGQDKDVLVELMGNEDRYDQKLEYELLEAGFEKYDKYMEFATKLEEIIDAIKMQNEDYHLFCKRKAYTYRSAVRDDYPELRRLWLKMIGYDSYTVNAFTAKELKEMEEYGRCHVICESGRIVAASIYLKDKKTAFGYLVATEYPGSGLGGAVWNEAILSAYQEGCLKYISWVRKNNNRSQNMMLRNQSQTGKFFWQFVCKSKS